MKRFICLLLSAILLLASVVPTLAAESNEPAYVQLDGRSPIPIIYIAGDGDPLYNKDGKQVLHWRSLLTGITEGDGDGDSSAVKDAVVNILYPFLVEGVLTNRWDNYYNALHKEIKDLFADALLDNDGNATNGTDIQQSRYQSNQNNMRTDRKRNGTYGFYDYRYWYDWRLDPLETADDFNAYIKAIKAVTGAAKVGICCSCLGTSVVMAYIAKYGMDDIQGVSFNAGMVNGAEAIGEAISGKFKLDPAAINRFLADCNALELLSLDSFITATIDLLDKNGVFDAAVGFTKVTLYYKLVEGVTSALARASLYTWPSYWASVSIDDYDDAMLYVFGEEGSDLRTEYAGLVEKIENYNTVVRQNLPALYKTIAREGNIAVVSKYGYQLIPICASRDELADQLASVYRTSYGATTSKVYSTLDEAYILRKTREGRGAYISPDKQIDASTCLFPDSTWFVKGASHSNWTEDERNLLLEAASADRQLTVDDFHFTQFMVWSNETQTMSPMTQENCDTYYWSAEEPIQAPFALYKRLVAFMKSLFNWFREAVRFFDSLKTDEAA